MGPRVLFVSPVVPNLTGNGLAMRAGLVLEAMAGRGPTSLLVFRLYAGAPEPPAELRRVCERIVIAPPRPPGAIARRFGPAARLLAEEFDAVHVFRMATLPLVRSCLEPKALHLDLDDIESETHARLAALCRLNGDLPHALLEEAWVRQAEAVEAEALRTADLIYVCSERDRAKLEARAPGKIAVLPNGIRLPAPMPPRREGGPFTFLFLGTLGYYPNADAVRFLSREIAPRMPGARFVAAGGGASFEAPGVELLGAAPAVEPVYAAADAVVVPIRAAGGTRIKILEAMAYGRPVVSTTMGAEGLEVEHERDILIADGPEAFAAACERLAGDPILRDRLSKNGALLVERRYSLEAVRAALGAVRR
jgi:glycosyltransferase involved in cell wall biosynthesis